MKLVGLVLSAGKWPTAEEAVVARERLLLHLGRPRKELARPEQSLKLGGASGFELQRLARARRKVARGASSRFIGVMRRASGGQWGIVVTHQKRTYRLSGYRDEQEAAAARDRLALYVVGRHVRLNFPDRKPAPASLEKLRRELGALNEDRDTKMSRYRGVTLLLSAGAKKPWTATIGVNGKRHFLGQWATQELAAIAHDRAARYYGLMNNKCLNLPERDLEPADAETLRAESRRMTLGGSFGTEKRRQGVSV